jgi:V-type H+-transporting ATPase subunit C
MEKKTRDALAHHFARLAGGVREQTDKKGKKIKDEPMDESVQMLLGDKDYFPYVSYTVAWDPLAKKD